MDTPTSQVSFIPKSPLVREESALDRKRPISLVRVLAITLFVSSVGAYASIYAYDLTLTKKIATETEKIRQLQAQFSNAPQVEEARVFRARAELMQELLEEHIVVSPVFEFLSKNTLERVFFDRFSFKRNDDGNLLVELSGEAPGYATLAYQMDVLRGKTSELAQVVAKDVTLSPFGTVTFGLVLVFQPEYLSYLKVNAGAPASASSEVGRTTESVNQSVSDSGASLGASTTTVVITPNVPEVAPGEVASGWSVATGTATSSDVVTEPAKKLWWSSLKFW